MSVDPKSQAVTNFFMVAAVVVMLALAWSIAQDNEQAAEAVQVPAQETAVE